MEDDAASLPGELPMPTIDAARFLKDLTDLRQIGAYKTGVHRPTYSPVDMESRRWLMAQMAEIGLEPSIDGIGNVYGRHKGNGPHVLVGSHIESQNYAGWLDGALGVVAGLALARAGLSVDVCAYADEEGHFEGGFLGSRSLVGELTEAQIDASRNRTDGTPLRAALAAAGLADLPRMTLEPGRHVAAFELHIEQGRRLEMAGQRAAVVSGIVGICQYRIEIEGQQNHAGTTTMAERRDAGLTAVRLLAAVDKLFPTLCSPITVWTTGRIQLDPGAPSIIPGGAEIQLQTRDLSVEVLDRLEAGLQGLIRESNRTDRCPATLHVIRRSVPALCDPALMKALAESAEAHAPGQWAVLHSGAGHDSQVLSTKMPAVMLFSPSIEGISHHWKEDTKHEDLALCCQILADGVARALEG
jgi:N-carbamoyl-L-amino-acid hydrolase